MQKHIKSLRKFVLEISQKVLVKYTLYLLIGAGGFAGLAKLLFPETVKHFIGKIIQSNISILGITLFVYQGMLLFFLIILSFFIGLIFKNIRIRKPKYYEYKGFNWKYNIHKFWSLQIEEFPYCINDKTKLIPERIKNYFYCPVCRKKFENTEYIEETIYTEVKHILESKYS